MSRFKQETRLLPAPNGRSAKQLHQRLWNFVGKERMVGHQKIAGSTQQRPGTAKEFVEPHDGAMYALALGLPGQVCRDGGSVRAQPEGAGVTRFEGAQNNRAIDGLAELNFQSGGPSVTSASGERMK